MRFVALATDYDGTLASHGRVAEPTLLALETFRSSGRKLILVTGRELGDLETVFSRLDLFDRVVAENGALLHRPALKETKALSEPPNESLIASLKARNVPFSVGKGILATWEPHQTSVLEAIHELGLEHHVVFNKGAVMVLPPNVNKGTGLIAALDELGLSAHNVVGIGDAENDHALLTSCECGCAVANALASLKERADIVTNSHHGAGVAELIDLILDDDLASYDSKLTRHHIVLGQDADNQPVYIKPARGSLLFAGPSGSGKSSAATGVLERLAAAGYQFCLFDPEGDFEHFGAALSLGTAKHPPEAEEVVRSLDIVRQNVVVNLLAIPLRERPLFFATLLPHLEELRARTARPHWIVVDEAHHLIPTAWVPASSSVPPSLGGMLLISVHPDHISRSVLRTVDTIIAIGKSAGAALNSFAAAIGESPLAANLDLDTGVAQVWFRSTGGGPIDVRIAPPEADRRRHRRKYAEGELGPDKSFYFRGPEQKLNLRAQNLSTFLQLAEGIDDETWLHHLRQGDYSKWFRSCVQDDELAAEAAQIETQTGISAQESKQRVKAAIEGRYTAAV